MSLTRNLLDASEDLSVEKDESCHRNDAGEDKSAQVLVIERMANSRVSEDEDDDNKESVLHFIPV